MKTQHLIPIFIIIQAITTTQANEKPLNAVDVYGARQLSKKQILNTLNLEDGTRQKVENEALEKKLIAQPGIAAAKIVTLQLPRERILLVGIREDGAEPLHVDAEPTGDVTLPQHMIQAHQNLGKARLKAIEERHLGEDTDQGHAILKYPPARILQESFVEVAKNNKPLLLQVLAEAADPAHRAAAAEIIAYSPNKKDVVIGLATALSDPQWDVRNNAARALAIIAEYANKNPKLKIEIPPDRFLQLIESVEFFDRNKAAMMLDELTSSENPKLLAKLRRQHKEAIAEMARWHFAGHADFSRRILGRMAGLDERKLKLQMRKLKRYPKVEKWVDDMLAKIDAIQ